MVKKIFVIGLSLLSICSYGFANKVLMTPRQLGELIIKEVDKIIGLKDIESKQKMTVYREDGTIRIYQMKVLTSGKDKAFAEIIEPPREKGRQVLRLSEIVWSYLPNVKRSFRVSGRTSFMGGDFEDNDVLRLNLTDDYIPKIIQESPDHYVLELKGKNLSLSYAKIKIWVKKEDFQPIKQEYFTLSDKLIKRVVYRNVRDFEGLKRPAVIEMQSVMSTKKKTTLELLEFTKGVKNPPKLFRRANLGK